MSLASCHPSIQHRSNLRMGSQFLKSWCKFVLSCPEFNMAWGKLAKCSVNLECCPIDHVLDLLRWWHACICPRIGYRRRMFHISCFRFLMLYCDGTLGFAKPCLCLCFLEFTSACLIERIPRNFVRTSNSHFIFFQRLGSMCKNKEILSLLPP